MKTSKSPLTVARMALRAARDSLPDHARAKSPKKFTQPQLMACLVIKEFLQLDYRGIHMLLAEWSDLRQVLGLTKIFQNILNAYGLCLRPHPLGSDHNRKFLDEVTDDLKTGTPGSDDDSCSEPEGLNSIRSGT